MSMTCKGLEIPWRVVPEIEYYWQEGTRSIFYFLSFGKQEASFIMLMCIVVCDSEIQCGLSFVHQSLNMSHAKVLKALYYTDHKSYMS